MHPVAIVFFGPSHLAVLALAFAVPVALVLVARRAKSPPVTDGIAWGLAGLLVATHLFSFARAMAGGPDGWKDELPMHLCDWATFITAYALAQRGRVACDLAWFWGLGGTFQAVLTPDLAADFPSIGFITFFLAHCGVVAGALFLAFALGMRPEPRSAWRAFLGCQVYLAAAGATNLLLGTNFGYLCAKPARASLMDWLGPWPFYIISLELVTVVTFALLYAPFFVADKMRRTNCANSQTPAKPAKPPKN
jgi:hypothetical integral membrane protein (TIGR02206 family)